ncbi:MAG: YaeQ family protein [Orrella sp.]
MALGATIYKTELHVADSDRHYYGSHSLTVARHPSETAERMMVRLVAFALNAHEELAFTRGISTADEPDIWLKDLTGAIELWIEVGQPTETRILKACGRANQVIVYCHNDYASQLWWDAITKKLTRAKNLRVVFLPAEGIRELANDVKRNMVLHVNVQEQELFISNDNRQVSLTPEVWRESSV